jgi:hypothetical protein
MQGRRRPPPRGRRRGAAAASRGARAVAGTVLRHPGAMGAAGGRVKCFHTPAAACRAGEGQACCAGGRCCMVRYELSPGCWPAASC